MKIEAVFGSVLLISLFGNAFSGYTAETGYIVQPRILYPAASNIQFANLQAVATNQAGYSSGGYSGSGGYSNGDSTVRQLDPIKNAASAPDVDADFDKQALDDAKAAQDEILGVSSYSTVKASTTTEAPAEEEEEIDFTPKRQSFFMRFVSFITRSFATISSFLRRIWNRLRNRSG